MKHHTSNESGATDVYYDGDCPMCTALMGRIKDSGLSWSMYLGTTNDATLVISSDALSRMPTRIASYAQEGGSGWYMLPISFWAMSELSVPPYPEARAYISIARDMCVYAKGPGEVLLDMKGRSSWFKKERREVIDCTQLR